MPFYEYICSSCKEEHLLFHSMVEDMTDSECPSCGDEKLVRVISSLEKVAKPSSTARSRVRDFIKSSKVDLKLEREELEGRNKK